MEHRDEQIIVVEYVGNGNLREHLDGKEQVSHSEATKQSQGKQKQEIDIYFWKFKLIYRL